MTSLPVFDTCMHATAASTQQDESESDPSRQTRQGRDLSEKLLRLLLVLLACVSGDLGRGCVSIEQCSSVCQWCIRTYA